MTKLTDLKLGPCAAILDVPANREFLKRVNSAKELSPEQLLKLAARYRSNHTTQALGNHLAMSALAKICRSKSINKAMKSVSETEIEWSIFGDIWDAIKGLFSGASSEADPYDCKYACVGVLLLEKCGKKDHWHIIGVCFGFSF
jgi:hypothetical protein